MKSIYPSVLEQIRSGSKCVLACVVRTSGSSPQKPGSSALFGEEGLLSGTVGGGLLEGEVQRLAADILISETSSLTYYNLVSGQGEEGAICGGEAYVLLDAHPARHLKTWTAMEESLLKSQRGFLLTVFSRDQDLDKSIDRYWVEEGADPNLLAELDPLLRNVLQDQLKNAIRYGFFEMEIQSIPGSNMDLAYLEHVKPKPRLIIAGAGHVGRALAHMGALLEFEVTVVDDRREYANRHNIPDAGHLVVQEIGSAMKEIKKDPDTYIVIVTRGHQQDAEALKPCIGSSADYIGMIGSAHKVAIMKEQFLENKWATPEQWSVLHTPIGIPIGSKTVEEIAISIAAQLVEVRSRKTAAHAR